MKKYNVLFHVLTSLRLYLIIFPFWLFFFSSLFAAGLGGDYTINSNTGISADYHTISDAIADLYSIGLGDDVIFHIEGEFDEQLIFNGNITNSDIYAIAFISVATPDDAIISYTSTSTADNFIVNINGAKNITLQNLKFVAKGTNYSRIIYSDNPHGKINFVGNNFEGKVNPSISALFNIVHIIADNSSEDISDITFESNEFNDGYFAIYLDSYTSPKSNNLTISNNIFNSNYFGIWLKEFDSPSIQNNSFNLISSTTINISYCNNSFSITNNKINTKDNTISNGIFISNSFGNPTNKGIISNNFIQANTYGIQIVNSNYIDFYFNTVNIENNPLSNNPTFYAFSHDETSENLNVLNNIFNNYREGYALIGFKVPSNYFDYNNYYTHGTYLVNWDNTNVSDLNSFVSGTSTNTNSYSEQVTFVSRTDLHIQSSPIPLHGINIPTINIDIDGDFRFNPPLLGADESTNPLNGIYTIGSGGNFPSITSAINALYTLGIDGAVIFKILNGTYNEQIVLDGPITGSSSTNIVTFQSNSGIPADVQFSYSASGDNDNFIIYLNNVEYLEFRNLTFNTQNSDFATIIELGSDIQGNLTFYGNVMNGQEYVSGGNTYQLNIVKINTYTKLHNTSFENNIINNGNVGLKLNFPQIPNTSFWTNNLKIIGNTIITYDNPIHITSAKNIEISSNTLQSTNGDNRISVNGCNEGIIISKNVIYGDGLGIFLWGCIGTGLSHAVIKNNIINTESKGIDIAGVQYADLFFNTVKSQKPLIIRETTYGYSYYLTTNIILKNNILHCVTSNSIPGDFSVINWEDGNIVQSDYNNLYITPNAFKPYYLAIHGTNKYEYLSDWQVAEDFDLNSIQEEPGYEHIGTDLHITSQWTERTIMPLNGIQIPSITEDVDGDVRSNPPYMGADEPHILKLNLKVLLEGPYNGTTMYANLTIPNDPAYDAFPYNFYPQLIPPIPVIVGNNIIDRVTVELLNGSTYEVVETQSAYVLQDGTVVDLDGISPVHFASPNGNYFISVKHRNHLSVMSASAISL